MLYHLYIIKKLFVIYFLFSKIIIKKKSKMKKNPIELAPGPDGLLYTEFYI